jgi:hypothetical protein
MSYPSDGRNHSDAILSEKNMGKYKSHYEKLYCERIVRFIHVGGTRTKIDFVIEFEDGTSLKKSLKKKTSLKKGSFDYINTSDISSDLIIGSKKIHEKYKGCNSIEYKDKMIQALSHDLQNISSEQLTKILIDKIIIPYREINGLEILETSTGTIYSNVEPSFMTIIENGGHVKIQKSSKIQMSYQIDLFDSNGLLQKECGLRIRLHLNNGWTKWLQNSGSSIVIKIQQDKVAKLIKK